MSLPIVTAGPTPPHAPAAAPPRGETWSMVRAMVSIGVACGALIVVVFTLTRPVIERNRTAALERAIFEVLPAATRSATFVLGADDRLVPLVGKAAAGAEVVHAGFDATGTLVGVAIPASGMGYQDTIRLLYAYTPSAHAVTGFTVLESRETPGLGDKIGFDPGFLANFERLEVLVDPATRAIVHPLEMAKHGEKQHPWQVDAITGATVSSRAVTQILAASTARWAPRIDAQQAELVAPPAASTP